jgi:Bifunctional DNA primase/polymerase, N-terminal
MSAPATFAELGEAALGYAARGWPVFPLKPGDKVPLISKAAGGNGVHDATTVADTISRWWTEHPAANIGLAAGPAFWVLDVDYDGFFAEEPDGADTLTALQRRFGRLPPTVRQYTGGMGWQFFFKPDPRIKNGVKVLPGLDTRAAGGYVVAPPSLHPDGRHYHWIAGPDELEIAAAPEWLIALLEPVELPQPVPSSRRPVRNGNLVRYAEGALHGAADKIASAPPGAQENTLNVEAYSIGRLVGGGIIPRDLAKAELVAAACKMQPQGGRRPWTHTEVAWRVDRALAAGARNPRTPEARP